jgi:cytochrome P450
MVSFLDFETRIAGYSKAALKKSMEGEEPTKPRTVFDALVSSKIPAQERTLQRLTDESSTILIAGVDTTARTLTATMCYLILYPEILAKLRAELQPYKNATWTQLESLPYLVSHLLHFAMCAS